MRGPRQLAVQVAFSLQFSFYLSKLSCEFACHSLSLKCPITDPITKIEVADTSGPRHLAVTSCFF